ncbi:MAG: hypothetical protein ACE3JN_00395 [Ectobacillus sp.]
MTWLFYFYLDSLRETKDLKKKLAKVQGESRQHIEANGKGLHPNIEETVREFSTVLYSGNNLEKLDDLTTKRGKAEVVPLGEKAKKPKTDVQMKINDIYIYNGDITENAAEIIAAIKRTITINGITTTSVHYVRMELQESDRWRIDKVAVLADIPAR